jgi:hypothetical protein
MGSQFKNDNGVITSKGSCRHVLLPVWLAIIVLLTATFGSSKTVNPNDKSPHPTTAPLTSVAGATPALRPAGEPPGQYLRFNRFTSKNGLSSNQVWDVVKEGQEGVKSFAVVRQKLLLELRKT